MINLGAVVAVKFPDAKSTRQQINRKTHRGPSRGGLAGKANHTQETRSMIPAQNLFETHLLVADLDQSIKFYRDLVGFKSAHVVPARQAAFFWIVPPVTRCLDCGGPARAHRGWHYIRRFARASRMPLQRRASCGLQASRRSTSTGNRRTSPWSSPGCLPRPSSSTTPMVTCLSTSPCFRMSRSDQGIVPWRVWELTHRSVPTSESSQTPRQRACRAADQIPPIGHQATRCAPGRTTPPGS
jgi:hypothetical protein